MNRPRSLSKRKLGTRAVRRQFGNEVCVDALCHDCVLFVNLVINNMSKKQKS